MRVTGRGRRAAAALSASLALLGTVPGAHADPRAPAGDRTPDRPLIKATHAVLFSPNGDGRQDRGVVRFRLSRHASVTVSVRDPDGDLVLRQRLGPLPPGRSTWSWDGRTGSGGRIRDGDYRAQIRAATHARAESVRTLIRVDTARPQGRLVSTRPTVHPRATVVHDRVQLLWLLDGWSPWDEEFWPDEQLATSMLEIRTLDGDLVWRRVVRDRYTPVFDWSGQRGGRPLPAGRYVARLTVTDTAGNRRRDEQAVRVSDAQLVERVWSTSLAAAAADTYAAYFGGCNGCYDRCAPVVSDRFPGGLSFRACTMQAGTSEYFAADVPFDPAPVDSYQVTASGGPPTLGSAARGWLDGVALGPGDASATGPWRRVDLTAYPFLPTLDQPVTWTFWTEPFESYDVAQFTVRYRTYVPAG